MKFSIGINRVTHSSQKFLGFSYEIKIIQLSIKSESLMHVKLLFIQPTGVVSRLQTSFISNELVPFTCIRRHWAELETVLNISQNAVYMHINIMIDFSNLLYYNVFSRLETPFGLLVGFTSIFTSRNYM
jgi:hypothetical protein